MVHRTLLEHFRDYARLTSFHGEVVRNVKTQILDVAYKWQSLIRSQSAEALREPSFVERVSRSAGYFLGVLEAQVGDALEKTKQARSQNEKANEQMEERYKELWMAYLSKDKVLRKMEEEPFDVPVYMMTKQEALLDAMDVVMPGSVRQRPRRRRKADDAPFGDDSEKPARERKPRQPRQPKGATAQTTYDMLLAGKRPEEIARERGLMLSTVYTHLAGFIRSGKLSADRVIDASKVRAIRHAIAQLPDRPTAEEVSRICRKDITRDEIYLMLNSR